MKKKLAAVMICAAMVAMLGVGCGSKSSDDSSSKSETKKTLTEDDIKDRIHKSDSTFDFYRSDEGIQTI